MQFEADGLANVGLQSGDILAVRRNPEPRIGEQTVVKRPRPTQPDTTGLVGAIIETRRESAH